MTSPCGGTSASSSPSPSALFALGSQPIHPVDFLFQIAPAGTTADGATIATIIPFGIAGAFALSLLQAQWTYTGYDASAHVAEETVAARTASAWGVFLSVAVSAIFGYIVLVALTLKMTTPEDVLTNSPGGYGVAYILDVEPRDVADDRSAASRRRASPSR